MQMLMGNKTALMVSHRFVSVPVGPSDGCSVSGRHVDYDSFGVCVRGSSALGGVCVCNLDLGY